MSVLCKAVVVLLLSLPAVARSQSFEAISIKPARPGDPRDMRMRVLPNGDLDATAVPVLLLLRYAYDVPANPSPRLLGLPGWRETYDINHQITQSVNHQIPYSSSDACPIRPVPTGYLHIGAARTAPFNWLPARRHGGVFVLCIEDTDVERSAPVNRLQHLTRIRRCSVYWSYRPAFLSPAAIPASSPHQSSSREACETIRDFTS